MPEFRHRHAKHAIGFQRCSDIASLTLGLSTDLFRVAQRTVPRRIEPEGIAVVPTIKEIHDVVERTGHVATDVGVT